MSVVPHPTHKGWWQIRYYPDGRKGKEEVVVLRGGTREEALSWEAELRRESRGSYQLDTFPSIGEVIPYYLRQYELDHLDTSKIIRQLDRWNKEIGRYKFNTVTDSVIEAYKLKRLNEGVGPSTINKELSALSGLLKYAHKRGYCHEIKIERFPAKKTRAPSPDVPTRPEVLALIDCAIWPKCGLLACLYFAGLRASEGVYLKAEAIYLDRGLMIVTGKGNKTRAVPIIEDLKPFLEKRLSEVDTGYLWTTRTGKPIKDIRQIINWSKKRAGITRHINPHLLRHAFGVHSTMSGVGMRQLQKAMGHSNITTTEIYTNLASEALVNEFKKFK